MPHNIFWGFKLHKMKTIKLNGSKELFALVDDTDFDKLIQFKWYPIKGKNTYYAQRFPRKGDKYYGIKKSIAMHRDILNMENKKTLVDHIDGNGLNNQKNNIREASYSQNNANRASVKNSSSKYLGVHRINNKEKFTLKDGTIKIYYWTSYQASIKIGGKFLFRKTFKNEEDAAIAYNEAAIIHHGEFARLNKI